eukprot:g34078.t1
MNYMITSSSNITILLNYSLDPFALKKPDKLNIDSCIWGLFFSLAFSLTLFQRCEYIAEAEKPTKEETSEKDGGVESEAGDNNLDAETDAEIEDIKKRLAEMHEEAQKIEALRDSVASQESAATQNGPEVDSRSIYVGNVDYSTTPAELAEFFKSCGTVNRVTIRSDKFGTPKGFAYVEFKEQDSVVNAMILNETEFKGRPLKISPKRTNIPGMAARGRGGGRGRGRGRENFSHKLFSVKSASWVSTCQGEHFADLVADLVAFWLVALDEQQQ